MKRLVMLILMTTLAQPVAAQEASNLQVNDTLPQGCGSNLVVVGYTTSWSRLVVDIDNPTSSTQSGGLVVDFVMDGQRFIWWFGGIDVPAQTLWQVTIEFPSTLTVLGVSACSDRPNGIVDAPDPVASTTQQKKKGK